MKFDFCIGNPPYQDESIGDNKTFKPPIYDKFLDSAFHIAQKVEMIHPARFLFNAGDTPKAWNNWMLNIHNRSFEESQFRTDLCVSNYQWRSSPGAG